jgi:CubicO group peptidase (beta-lactamase class C family)
LPEDDPTFRNIAAPAESFNLADMQPLMQGFPPGSDEQVTLENWRSAPFNRWAFHHVRELIPTAEIANDRRQVWWLPRDPVSLPVGDLEATNTDGIVVVHRGRIVFEHYANGMTEADQHILMSVTKSVLGLVAGTLVGRGILDPDRPVADVIPELKATAYKGATVRHLLDMRAGVAYEEDYWATSRPIVEYRKATGWNPIGPGETPSDLRSFFTKLTRADGSHGGRFHYISPNTDLLGWIIERAAGRRYADLTSELLWRPMGAEHNAYITVDRRGAPRCAGGMCVTAGDLARVGQLIVEGGRGIVPSQWIEDIFQNGSVDAWNAGRFVEYFPGLPMHYRSKWYVVRGDEPLAFALGIHGQNLFVNRGRQIVIAKLSSQAPPLNAPLIAQTMKLVDDVRNYL